LVERDDEDAIYLEALGVRVVEDIHDVDRVAKEPYQMGKGIVEAQLHYWPRRHRTRQPPLQLRADRLRHVLGQLVGLADARQKVQPALPRSPDLVRFGCLCRGFDALQKDQSQL
jgi:hypothetical protein